MAIENSPSSIKANQIEHLNTEWSYQTIPSAWGNPLVTMDLFTPNCSHALKLNTGQGKYNSIPDRKARKSSKQDIEPSTIFFYTLVYNSMLCFAVLVTQF